MNPDPPDCPSDGSGNLYEYGPHINDVRFTVLPTPALPTPPRFAQHTLTTPINVGSRSYRLICVSTRSVLAQYSLNTRSVLNEYTCLVTGRTLPPWQCRQFFSVSGDDKSCDATCDGGPWQGLAFQQLEPKLQTEKAHAHFLINLAFPPLNKPHK